MILSDRGSGVKTCEPGREGKIVYTESGILWVEEAMECRPTCAVFLRALLTVGLD